MSRQPRGFTLIELTVVIAIVGLLLGGLLVPLSTQLEANRYQAAQRQLETANEALIGFAIANGNRLPCPDNDGDGQPDPPGAGACAAAQGFLPAGTLGLQPFDPWGNRLRYQPADDVTLAAGFPAAGVTTDLLEVRTRTFGGVFTTLVRPSRAVAVVFSCGRNATAEPENFDGGAAPPANCGNPPGPLNDIYISDVYEADVFDDVVDWISTNAFLARLVRAGTWPRQ